MIRDRRPGRIRRRADLQLNVYPLVRPREALLPEATTRLAQQIATILQRIRAEDRGRVDQFRRGD